MPRSSDEPSTAETVVKASSMIMKYSPGPNCSATSAATGANIDSSTVAMVPATNEPIAAVASAGPARPFLAIRLPSMAVTMVEDSPGVFIRIEVVEPPYIAP
ncbi:hypothetical protein D9M72_542010 [compost metagenome]